MTTESLLTSALEYHSRGWSVIPLKPGSKIAAVQWKQYQDTKSTTDEIEEWWGRDHTHNIGIVTGQVSNLLVIDVDDHTKGVRPTWTTLSVKTPGGMHYYFKPDEHISSYISQTGLGIRSNGAYVVAPPSTSKDGAEYTWTGQYTDILPIETSTIQMFAPNRHAV